MPLIEPIDLTPMPDPKTGHESAPRRGWRVFAAVARTPGFALCYAVTGVVGAGVGVYLFGGDARVAATLGTIALGLVGIALPFLLALAWAFIIAPYRQRDDLRRVIQEYFRLHDGLRLEAEYEDGVLTCRVANDLRTLTALVNMLVPDGLGLTLEALPTLQTPAQGGKYDRAPDSHVMPGGGKALRWAIAGRYVHGGQAVTQFPFRIGTAAQPFKAKFTITSDETGPRDWVLPIGTAP